ncbi:TPA: hypothetical protein ACLEB8_005144 [Pseudomonas aeruginosa]
MSEVDLDEVERHEAGVILAKEFPRDVARVIRELSKDGITTTELEVAKLWFEFSMWWVAEWLPLPKSNLELRYIFRRGLRLEPISERDWGMRFLDGDEYVIAYSNCSAVPIRWDVTPVEFDAAAQRLLGSYSDDRRHVCESIAKKMLLGRLNDSPTFDEDIAKVRLVASAYWHPAGRRSPSGYPR